MSEGGEYMSERAKYCPLDKAYSEKLMELYAKVMNEELDKAMDCEESCEIGDELRKKAMSSSRLGFIGKGG